MSGVDDQSSSTHWVSCSAKDLSLGRRVVGDAASILQVLSVAKGHGSDDPVPNAGRDGLDSLVSDGCTLTVRMSDIVTLRFSTCLPVATGDNLSVGALVGSGGQLVDHVGDTLGVGTVRERVGGQGRGVVDALSSHIVGAIPTLESLRHSRPDDGTLSACQRPPERPP